MLVMRDYTNGGYEIVDTVDQPETADGFVMDTELVSVEGGFSTKAEAKARLADLIQQQPPRRRDQGRE